MADRRTILFDRWNAAKTLQATLEREFHALRESMRLLAEKQATMDRADYDSQMMALFDAQNPIYYDIQKVGAKIADYRKEIDDLDMLERRFM